MSYNPCYHFFSHVVMHASDSDKFSLSSQYTKQLARRGIDRQRSHTAMAVLYEQLQEAKSILSRMQHGLSEQQYNMVVSRVQDLEKKIEEKKKKLDL